MIWFFSILFLLGFPLGAEVPAQSYNLSLYLMEEGRFAPQDLAAFLLTYNPSLESDFALFIAQVYVEESAQEGVNHDMAFMQMLLETGFLKYGGQVQSNQNNFCGLGALDGGYQGASFSSVLLGVRAHVQHIKAYASVSPLNNPLIDPRFHFVVRGEAEHVYDLAGRWASDPDYGYKIASLADRFIAFHKNQSNGS